MFARSICGEGFPDFYAKQAIGSEPSCYNPTTDKLLAPFLNKLGICMTMASYGYDVD